MMNDIVHIVEFPDPDDIFAGRSEAQALSYALDLHGIDSDIHTIMNIDHLEKWISNVTNQFDSADGNYRPILHFSGHGNREGISLIQEEDDITWEDLHELLKPIIRRSAKELILCFSTCYGEGAISMGVEFTSQFKYCVGPNSEPDWDEALVAYSSFYHNLVSKKLGFEDAIISMNMAINRKEILFTGIEGSTIAEIAQKRLKEKVIERVEKYSKQVDSKITAS